MRLKPDLAELIMDIKSRDLHRTKPKPSAVAIFDLPGSTALKLERGHYEGARRALHHNLLCQEVAEAFEGRVVKHLGDGILVCFDDAVNACRAAVAVKAGLRILDGMKTKAGITFGEIEELTVNGVPDILGDTVDRCARLQALARPNQIIVDGALRDAVRSHLRDYGDLRLSESITIRAKGVGVIEACELVAKGDRPTGFDGVSSFTIHEGGRLSLPEKVEFLEGARSEIIELGIGLTTFAQYFVSRKPSEFRDHVWRLLAVGVDLKCFALDTDCEGGKQYAKHCFDPGYLRDMKASSETLRTVSEDARSMGLKGGLEMHVYSCLPLFHCVCVDGGDASRGRLTVSHYIHGVRRAECPVMQFTRKSNPAMFRTYWRSVAHLVSASKRVW